MTKRNTMLTTFSQQTDEQVYLNNQRNQNASQYDDVVLAPSKKRCRTRRRRSSSSCTCSAPTWITVTAIRQITTFQGQCRRPGGAVAGQVQTYNFYDNAVRTTTTWCRA
jgi:heptose-I-phosphate ethanolaminephosphotransferase